VFLFRLSISNISLNEEHELELIFRPMIVCQHLNLKVCNDFRYSHITIDTSKFNKNNNADLEFSISKIKNKDVESRRIDNLNDGSLEIQFNILFFIDHITHLLIIQFSFRIFVFNCLSISVWYRRI